MPGYASVGYRFATAGRGIRVIGNCLRISFRLLCYYYCREYVSTIVEVPVSAALCTSGTAVTTLRTSTRGENVRTEAIGEVGMRFRRNLARAHTIRHGISSTTDQALAYEAMTLVITP